ncbi:hypothetical protein NDU88_006867 [Pleurodeles waltl]|uniref:Uncharacterized protein n=1 Tax=Pleurodeles waltl TaxID=8319 RepID=A0AAV7VS73_PLEWA|nr:hypothetical protein NDU88_006867 [Pleurodeles waltl]
MASRRRPPESMQITHLTVEHTEREPVEESKSFGISLEETQMQIKAETEPPKGSSLGKAELVLSFSELDDSQRIGDVSLSGGGKFTPHNSSQGNPPDASIEWSADSGTNLPNRKGPKDIGNKGEAAKSGKGLDLF